MSVFDPLGEPLPDRSQRVSVWEGTLPLAGEYTLQLQTVRGVPDGDYGLSVTLSLPPTPTPTPEPTPTPLPEVEVETLQFPQGQTDVQAFGHVNDRRIVRYLVSVAPDRIFAVELFPVTPEGEDVRFTVRRPDGQPISAATGVVFWQSQVSEGGMYQIDVTAPQPRDFELSVSVYDRSN